jgi:uncharacterized protein YihD (DUF1040 family)
MKIGKGYSMQRKQRDPKRIAEILDLLDIIWTNQPDMRLGQIISCFNCPNYDIFYLEDDALKERMLTYLQENQ